MKVITQSMLLCLAAALLAGCAGTGALSGVRSVAADPLIIRVGITPNAPPIVFKQGKQVRGLEADFAALLGNATARSIVFVEAAWDQLVPALEAGKIDIIMSGASVTPGRAMRVAFADPYLQVGQLLLVRSEDRRTYRYPQTLLVVTSKIGVEKGTTADIFVQRYCTRSERVKFASIDDAVKALKRKRVDVVMHDAPVIWQVAAENEAQGITPILQPLTKEYLAWAVRRGDTELLVAANRLLAEMKQDGRLDTLIERWIPLYRRFVSQNRGQ